MAMPGAGAHDMHSFHDQEEEMESTSEDHLEDNSSSSESAGLNVDLSGEFVEVNGYTARKEDIALVLIAIEFLFTLYMLRRGA